MTVAAPRETEALTLGAILRKLRRKRGLSQLQLALAAGTTQDRISAIERSGRVRVGTFVRIMTAMDVKVVVDDEYQIFFDSSLLP